ncbi:unnamed protein product [Toxocara canis]|uniref:Ubiquitinyl hydrolase 1 n=1 Tax=Toxocara canis TaxID=6265 RepID=A0A183UUH5_TOXCA|nr:unnamed protein product [Toxocara canis]
MLGETIRTISFAVKGIMKTSASVEDMKTRGRCPAQTSSVAVSLHPLVIMNISEHWTRIWAQSSDGKPTQATTMPTHDYLTSFGTPDRFR